MDIKEFKEKELKKLYKPYEDSGKEDNGQITIIGGSKLFHGSPIFALKVASRIVDMVFFTSPEPSVGKVAERIKSKLNSFIWVPFEEVEEYIRKSDAVLIGPGLMRFHRETQNAKRKTQNELDEAGRKSKRITETLLKKFPKKQWVIDAGSLQVMEAKHIPQNAILTPNKREFEILFGEELGGESICCSGPKMAPRQTQSACSQITQKHRCIIVLKNIDTFVCSPKECMVIKGGNAGLTKGGTGDVLAGLVVALAAKNPPFLAACAASFLTKKAADELHKKVGFAYNADDLADQIPQVLGRYFR